MVHKNKKYEKFDERPTTEPDADSKIADSKKEDLEPLPFRSWGGSCLLIVLLYLLMPGQVAERAYFFALYFKQYFRFRDASGETPPTAGGYGPAWSPQSLTRPA